MGATRGWASRTRCHSPDSTLALIVSAPAAASETSRCPMNVAGTTTIRPITRTETEAARLARFTVDFSHRWTGMNKTASASAQVSAGTNGSAIR